METIKDYRYEEDENLPEGWNLAVYDDGLVIVCSPGTCPEELGGYSVAVSYDEAMEKF